MDDIHIPYKGALFHNGQLNGHDAGAKLFVYFAHHLVEVGVFPVHLVDDHHAGFARLFAHGHGLFRSHHRAGNSAYHDQGRVRQRHGSSHFAIKIEKARGVNDVDLDILPLEGRQRGVDGNGALDLFGIVVGGGIAVFHLTDTLDQTGIKKHCLGKGGFPFAAVAENADIADVCCGIVLHGCPPVGSSVVV